MVFLIRFDMEEEIVMKKAVKLVVLLMCMTIFMCACGSDKKQTDTDKSEGTFDKKADSNEDYFEWDGNLIVGITEEGMKQESILIPARCEGFFDFRFSNTEIKHVAFEDDDDVDLENAFMGAKNVTSVELPAKLTKIPNSCFYGCDGLKSITIPAEVTTIEKYAFSYCAALENVTFEGQGVTVITENSFQFCKALKSIVIPESVITIEESAFDSCEALESVTLNEGLKTIAGYAFHQTALTEVHFPEGIQFESMQENAFGLNTYSMTVYIVKDSWCDMNQEAWNIGFKEIKYE